MAQLRRARTRTGRRQKATEYWLDVSGFKAIRDPAEVHIRPITVLCGGNSSGKTSILQPLLLVKQTLEVAYDPGPLLLSGDNVKFSSVNEMLWHGRGSDVSRRMSLGFTDFDGELTRLTFKKGQHGPELEQLDYRPPKGEDSQAYSLKASSTPEELRKAMRAPYREIVRADAKADFRLTRSRCFFEVTVTLDGVGRPQPTAHVPTFTVTDHDMMVTRATDLIHLPGLRDNPSRFYPATQVGNVFPGVFQPYVASIIAAWGDTGDDRLRELGEWLSRLGLTWKVEAKRIDDTRVALRVGRLLRPAQGGARDMVNIADVGLGVSQTLPVLVALLIARPSQIVYLEQPEIHLHPHAQVVLASLISEAARRGVVVITETHSYLLLRGLQEVTARTGVTGLVKLHWFTRDEKGAVRVDSADLDASGAFGDWPADFSDVELEVEERYVRTAFDSLSR